MYHIRHHPKSIGEANFEAWCDRKGMEGSLGFYVNETLADKRVREHYKLYPSFINVCSYALVESGELIAYN